MLGPLFDSHLAGPRRRAANGPLTPPTFVTELADGGAISWRPLWRYSGAGTALAGRGHGAGSRFQRCCSHLSLDSAPPAAAPVIHHSSACKHTRAPTVGGTAGCTGVQRGAQGYGGVRRGTAGCTGVQRGAQGYGGVPRGQRGIQKYTGYRWSTTKTADACARTLLMLRSSRARRGWNGKAQSDATSCGYFHHGRQLRSTKGCLKRLKCMPLWVSFRRE